MSAAGKATPGCALVTGAGRRIGHAIAADLGRRGWAVAVHHHRSAAEADTLVDDIRAAGGRAVALAADLADEAATARLIPRAVDALGPLTCLVNNASVFANDRVGGLTRASWDSHVETNLRAPLVLAEAFAGQVPEGTAGNIVNLLDQRVWNLGPGFVSYTVSKSALWTLTRTLALALAPGIRVNGIGPGPALPSRGESDAAFAAHCARLPLGRGTSPAEICAALRFILAAPAMTGQMIALDGGEHLSPRAPTAATTTASTAIAPPSSPAATRRIIISDLMLDCTIGIYRHERESDQRVRINLELEVRDREPPDDDIAKVIDYDHVVAAVRAVAAERVNLVETLAERIADRCTADDRVFSVRIRVEKLDAVPGTSAVGVEIRRPGKACP